MELLIRKLPFQRLDFKTYLHF
ncbi:hypothetical protein AZE42_12014 [Rhizopogon vesiculosus]|uniref:Uncharacterized protein n=1 Tax=Rhizopogon vesiculosus TaxID=180088 RepID=A0A1J8PM18_9AGAM|nr:hypothetical protein AZE42_12014 [Rhizopogon vesiculosus]